MKQATWFFNGLVFAALVFFIATEYRQSHINETGYTAETRARMDELVANITPLSTADLGE